MTNCNTCNRPSDILLEGLCCSCWKEKAEKAEAAAAEMRPLLEKYLHSDVENDEVSWCPACSRNLKLGHFDNCALQHALSIDAGRDFVPRAELEKAQAAIQATKDEMFGRFLQWRGIDREEDACKQCRGAGVFMYGSTAMWRGGIGGQMMTMGMCSKCWGSGQESRPWLSPADAAKLREHANALELSNSQQAVEVIRLTEDNKRLRTALEWYRDVAGDACGKASAALKGESA